MTLEQDTPPQPELGIKPLPINYRRTYNPNETEYKLLRLDSPTVKEARIVNTDAQIEAAVRKKKESQNWFTTEYWRRKGIPKEQIEFSINGFPITIYNYSGEKPFTEPHVTEIQEVLTQLAARFPQSLTRLRWILVDDIQLPSALGDPEKLPTNGKVEKQWDAFRLFPRGMELSLPHRVTAVSNFKGTTPHELTHLIEEEFEQEWNKNFQWGNCVEHPEDWETKKIPGYPYLMYVNKHTGDLAPFHVYPLQREQCINYYAALHPKEDVPESMVAYIWDPDLLQRTSETKMKIFENHDITKQPEHNKQQQTISYHRVANEDIKLPEVQPEIVTYYIVEPELMGID